MRLLLTISLSLNCLVLMGMGCNRTALERPVWNGRTWAGNHENQTIERKQDDLVMKTSDPRFSGGVWMSYESLECLFIQFINNVEAWKDPKKECVNSNPDAVRKFLELSGY